MGKKSKASKDLKSIGLLLFIYRHRVPLLSIILTAFIVSLVVSLLITPRYRSSVILYPAGFTSMSRSLLGPASVRGDIMTFGLEADTERLLQVLHSDAIREKMIEKYDLLQHYGISESSRFPYTALNSKFKNNVRFRKTEYMAIEIEVLDTDPVIAAAMANDIAGHLDSVMNKMLNERAYLSLNIVEEEYNKLMREVALLQDSLTRIRELGVIDYESQSEVLNNAYSTAILNRDTESINFFRERLRILSIYGGTYVSLRDNLVYLNDKLYELQSAYDETRVNAEKMMPYKFTIDEAREAEKKAYPQRLMIIVVSTISTFLLALFILLLFDAFRRQLQVHLKK